MGGRTGRTLFATTASLSLLLSNVGGIGTTAAGDACTGSGTAASAPPGKDYADDPAIVVRVNWGKQRRNTTLTYLVTGSSEPLGNPYGGVSPAGWSAGCDADAIAGCETVEPLILTDAPIAGSNTGWPAEGRYTIVAGHAAACAYYEGGKPKYAKAPDPMPVTASIEYYPAGAKGPSASWVFESVDVPTYELTPMDESARRILGTFDWHPATGVSNVMAATPPTTGAADSSSTAAESDTQAAELPPLPPGVIAGAPPGPDDFSARVDGPAHPDDVEADTGGSALDLPAEPHEPGGPGEATAPDAPAGTTVDPLKRLIWVFSAIGEAFYPLDEASEADFAVTGVVALRAIIVLALRTALDRGEDTDDLVGAYHALGLLGLLLADDSDEEGAAATPVTDGKPGKTAEAPKPKKDPPKLKGRAKKQQREWVWLPAPAVVYQTYPTVAKKTLKTGTWYQLKDNDDGSRDFYSKKGKWIGTSPVKEREQVVVRKQGEKPRE